LVEAPRQALVPPPPDGAQIVFLEPINSIQGMFAEGVFEVNGNDRTLRATTAALSKDAVSKSHAERWKAWQAKTPQEWAELTLNPEDGVAP
jgi:hypothetical protein